MFARFGFNLKDDYHTIFKVTPLEPWINVIPQLLPRLHHPISAVRDGICELLCRIAATRPQLLMYQAIIGTEGRTKSPFSRDLYLKIVGSLDRSRINELSKWILELQRVTVLWHEVWAHGIG
jgi:serine/threonine-protein kinase SMG1